VSAEPWSVEDLLHKDDIIDKVPLQRLQLLGIYPTLQTVSFQKNDYKIPTLQVVNVFLFLLQVSPKSLEIFFVTPI